VPDDIERILDDDGPSRSAAVASKLIDLGMSAEAARQRISRARPPVRKFPIPLLPKNEAFLYLDDQRTTEQMWSNFVRDLRETNSVYAGALDGLAARGGLVPVEDFPIIAGAPIAMKAQVTSDRVINQLTAAGIVRSLSIQDIGDVIQLAHPGIGAVDHHGVRPRRLGEAILLDALKEWVRRTGLGGFNSVAIRGDAQLRQVGQFRFDLTAASYILPLRAAKGGKPGFLGADVFADGELNEDHIRYFVRKTQLLNATLPNGKALSLILAPSFTGQAYKVGHAAGIMMATPSDLFGRRAGRAIVDLVGTLKNAAAVVAGNPERFAALVEDLTQVEGAAGNIRGVLFELICFYLARRNAVSADFGVTARDPSTGETRDIDVLALVDSGHITAIECKGRAPGGFVQLEDVQNWLGKLRIMRVHLAAQERFREAQIQFELWTSGTFTDDALTHLRHEKHRRTRTLIDWKDGTAVAELARASKEKAILKGLQEHFLHHPLATINR
jgi:hypothetical protein